ncbi:dihydrodipicolinate synthase family protein [Flavihumibacter sp. UBA7668]|uniref:dihydrodipicolinate synthase family protein n=1 Tax=Flavihumibacter sp. UBA7668 TaxID=1946542 RepID=UPI0025C1F175|nr:dihydrodipicolinate synthase family protein [Flavihumibacter sp. UBA7668]
MNSEQQSAGWLQHLRAGKVIPALPLALTESLQIDQPAQERLIRYYMASGAGGLAVGVHTTQFEIRDPAFNLLEPIFKMAAEEIERNPRSVDFIKVAGICGPTEQALKEAQLAVNYGFHIGLLSMGGLPDYSEADLLERTKAIAAILPVFGFYLQPAVGGRVLSYSFWSAFAEIPNVVAIKIAAFNRYQTLDVVRAVAYSKRNPEISLYTGNDDNIVADLLTTYRFKINGKIVEKKFSGGLLGHWAVWTSKAVELLARIKDCRTNAAENYAELLTIGAAVTDMNAVVFDAANKFKGCIAGIHEVLRRQGLLNGIYCLSPEEKLSPGQAEELDRVAAAYPEWTDDEFAKSVE